MRPSTIQDRFALAVGRHPDRVAIVAGNERLSYGDVFARACRLAHRLVEVGARTDRIVAVVVDDARGDFVAAVMAVWFAGATYLPVDPRMPLARTRRLLDEAQPVAVVGARAVVTAYATVGAVTVPLDEDAAADPTPVTRPEVGIDDEDLAYIVHTSGSTGEPKAVAVPYRALETAYRGWSLRDEVGDCVRTYLQAAGPSYDVHITDIVRALCSGGCLVLCPASVLLDPPRLWTLIAAAKVDTLTLTPAVIRLLVDWMVDAGQRLDTVTLFVSGGELCRPDDIRRVMPLLHAGAQIVNAYGVAEAGVDSTSFDVTEHSLNDDHVPIGFALPEVTFAVLDEERRPVSPGADGELYLGGPGLARGYHRRPDATAERFVPGLPGMGERMYRTGDLVRQRADGALVHLGRVDDEVKVSGVRVRLGGIESLLMEHEAVANAAVLCRRVGAQDVLVAHVAPTAAAASAAPSASLAAQLREHLSGLLPAAVVPAELRVHAELPVNASGKVDRAALAALAAPPAAQYQPAGDVERRLAEHWTRLLGRPPSSPIENLFHAGASSLTAARLAVAIQREFSVDFPVATVLSGPCLHELAAAVSAASPRTVARASGRDTAPFALGQYSLWLLHQLNASDPTYHMPTVLRLSGPVRVDVLRAALDRLIERNDALRSRVVVDGGPAGPCLRVEAPMPWPFESVQVGAQRAAFIDQFVRRPFDLTQAPLARAALLALGDDRHELVLVVHHLVFDDWSERVLLSELGELYSAGVTGQPTALRPTTSRCADLAIWRADRMAGPVGAAQRAYWRDRLAELPPPLDLPTTASGTRGGRPRQHVVELPPALTARVRALATTQGVTCFVILLTALFVILRRWSGQSDLVIGTPLGHRDRLDTVDTIGFLVSTLPLRMRITDEAGFADLLPQTAATLAEASSHADVPFHEIVHDLGIGAADGARVFRVWFNWLGAPTEPPAMAGLVTELAAAPVPGALFDLGIYVTEDPDRFRVRLVHDIDVLDSAHMAELLEQYVALIEDLCAQPRRPVVEHRLRSSRAARLLPTGRQDLRRNPPELIDRLTDVAHAHADRIAVRSDTEDLTYAQLYANAADLSTRLVSAGVDAATIVPIEAVRVPELVSAVLGVLGAGASFSLLDAAQPAARRTEQLRTLESSIGVRLRPQPDEFTSVCPRWIDARAQHPVSATWPLRAAGVGRGHVVFTSGTTGRPLALRADLEPLANFLSWYTERHQISTSDRFALLSGLGHDPVLRDLFTPLYVGATLCVPPADLLRRPDELLAWLAAEGVTVAHITPGLGRLLSASRSSASLPALRLLVCAGDVLYRSDVATFRGWAPRATVLNAYGTTETPQIISCGTAPERSVPSATVSLSVGGGVPGAELLVLADSGGPAGIGELGTIVVRSPYLARSLHTELAAFTDDPVAGHRRFTTGDLGRFRVDGTVTVHGRRDDQISTRGFRVELAELDRWLRTYPDVRDAAAATRTGPDGDNQIVAYVVPTNSQAPPTEALRAHLRRVLPEHMLPIAVETVAAITLTHNGKVDRTRLARAVLPRNGPSQAISAPATGIERLVATVWREILRIDQLGADQNVFDAGATSLMVANAHAELHRVLGRPIPITALFEHATVRDLARHLDAPEPDVAVGFEPKQARRLTAVRDRRLAARSATARGTEARP